jgi:ribosome-associated protein
MRTKLQKRTSRAAASKRAAASPARKRKTKSPLLSAILTQLEDAKAENIVTIDLNGKSAIADGMVVASGRSNRHVGAIVEQLEQKLKQAGFGDLRVEGMPQCDWVLLDARDIVVHIFRPEVRSFYNLEKLWSEDAPTERRLAG